MSLLDIEDRNPDPGDFPVGSIGNFQELTVGAGANLFKFNSEGGFMGAANFSNAPLKFDYLNNRILVNDGTNDRVLIGKGVGLF